MQAKVSVTLEDTMNQGQAAVMYKEMRKSICLIILKV